MRTQLQGPTPVGQTRGRQAGLPRRGWPSRRTDAAGVRRVEPKCRQAGWTVTDSRIERRLPNPGHKPALPPRVPACEKMCVVAAGRGRIAASIRRLCYLATALGRPRLQQRSVWYPSISWSIEVPLYPGRLRSRCSAARWPAQLHGCPVQCSRAWFTRAAWNPQDCCDHDHATPHWRANEECSIAGIDSSAGGLALRRRLTELAVVCSRRQFGLRLVLQTVCPRNRHDNAGSRERLECLFVIDGKCIGV